jgi:hypothetical protein
MGFPKRRRNDIAYRVEAVRLHRDDKIYNLIACDVLRSVGKGSA